LLELARHGTGPAYPAAHLAHDARQLLRSQHDERQDEDDQDLRESDVEHGRFSVETCGCRMSPDRRGALARLGRARTLCPQSRETQALRSLLAVASALGVALVSVNSASGASDRICRRGDEAAFSSCSPSFTAFLKPRTAWPRSSPTLRSFLAPKTTSTTTRMISSSFISIKLGLRSAYA